MSTKHTPGPWVVRDDSDKAPFTFRVRADLSHRKHDASEESVCITGSEANARLIAAAPELLEALQSALVGLQGANKIQCLDDEIEQVEKAIAKATGGEE